MEPQHSLTHSTPPDLNGNYPWGYEGTKPEHVSSQQPNNNTSRGKRNVRLNDQLIPKPTDINIAEKMIRTTTLKEHPYSSHISRFALFPSFSSPDDPETGVRAASRPFIKHSIPSSAPDVTLLSKTIGGPYRHEILETPEKTKKKTVTWTGEEGFLDCTKPFRGEKQVFYPTPPKTVLPTPKLREWDKSLSERTSNMLKNLERTHWLTSYQMHYTGSGPANPLKIDDFREKMSRLPVMNSRTAPLQERSYPVFVPSEAKQGRRRRQRNSCSPTADELLNTCSDLSSGSATIHQPQEITATHNEAPHPDQMGHSQSVQGPSSTEAQRTKLSQETLHKQQSTMKGYGLHGSQKANIALMSTAEQPMDLYNRPHSQGGIEVSTEKRLSVKNEPCGTEEYFKSGRSLPNCNHPAVAKDQTSIKPHAEFLTQAPEQEGLAEGRQLLLTNPCILPRPPVLPGIQSVDRVNAALSLQDIQDSFSKTKAHHSFNSSITRAAVDLRDNTVSGKKHNFYGINCCYIHG